MEGLAELHTHLGGSVSSDILWSLAHRQGIALPVKDFWDFDRLVTVSDPRGVPDLDALDAIYHWTELIQSSPAAVEVSVHEAIGGAYRSQGITTLELRFNPMKRNRGGERDLDHIILAAIRGLDVASLEYPQVRAGLILMMDRTFSPHQNEVIVEKAIRWAPRGVVGIDIAGPRPGGGRYDYAQVQPMVEEARAAGLGVTIHVGEEGAEMGRAEIGEVLELLRPDRIGHGILAAGDDELMKELREQEVVLEICPTSNLLTKALADEDALRDVFRTFVDNGVLFTNAESTAPRSASGSTRWSTRLAARERPGPSHRRRAVRPGALRLAGRYLPDHPQAARPSSVRWVDNQNGRWGSCTPADATIRISDRMPGMPGLGRRLRGLPRAGASGGRQPQCRVLGPGGALSQGGARPGVPGGHRGRGALGDC